jgi:proton-translocating NADH-quinone oxidoreductase chain N
MNPGDLRWIVPEIMVAALAVALIVADVFLPREHKRLVGVFALIGLIPAALASGLLLHNLREAGLDGVRIFADTYTVDPFAIYFKLIALIATALVILVGMDYFPKRTAFVAETHVMLVFTCLGLMLMAGASDLIMILLSIEFVSLASYLLVGYLKGDPKSNEAGVKYFLYGAAATGVMFYGFSLLYGLTGSMSLYHIAERLGDAGPLAYAAVAMALAGFGFKISMVPFHQWTPDVYEGAPTPITAYLSVGAKAAGFAVLVRTLDVAVPTAVIDWKMLIAVLAALSMTIGNLLALSQRNVKRMLAYSSISHAGFLLIAVAAWESMWAQPALLIYLLAYLFTNLGAFFVAMVASEATGSEDIPDHAGLSQRAPWVAFAMAVFMLSLTGIPPTAGFLGKFYLFSAALDAGLLWLAVVGVVNSVISVYYYLGVVRAMYLMPPTVTTPVAETPGLRAGLAVAFVGTLVVGLYPQPFLLAIESVRRLLAGT